LRSRFAGLVMAYVFRSCSIDVHLSSIRRRLIKPHGARGFILARSHTSLARESVMVLDRVPDSLSVSCDLDECQIANALAED
jgi:hypothetical protein